MVPAAQVFAQANGAAQDASDIANTELSPEQIYAKAYNEARTAFDKGDFAAAAPLFEKAIQLAPPTVKTDDVLFTLGAAYFNSKQYPQAIEALQRFLSRNPPEEIAADARFSMAQSQLLSQNYNDAAATFKSLRNVPKYRQQVLLLEATAYRDAGEPDKAIEPLSVLTANGINNPATANGMMMLAEIYVAKKDSDKAVDCLVKVLDNLAMVDNPMRLNTMAVGLGDQLLQDTDPIGALKCFRIVQSKDQLLTFQAARLKTLQEDIDHNLDEIRKDPTNAAKIAELRTANILTEGKIEKGKATQAELEKLPDFMPGIILRIGQSYFDQNKQWEAIAAYTELLREYPEPRPETEPALYSLIVASANANRGAFAQALCERYLKEFPKEKNAGTVGYLYGASALQAQDLKGAETYFGTVLAQQPDNERASEMRFLIGNAQFGQGKYEEARTTYENYIKNNPDGVQKEEAEYRIALSYLFGGDYKKALDALTAYLKAYPQGAFASDAEYRMAVCTYASSDFKKVVQDCDNWEQKYGESTQQIGEVLALKADAEIALGDNDAALANYIRSYKLATTDEVLNYSIFEAQKLLKKKGQWAEIEKMFTEFVASHPDHPTALAGIYYIAAAKSKLGKTEEARTYVADNVLRNIDDPKKDSVEQLLTQLAQLCVKKPRPEPGQEAKPYDPAAILDSLLPADKITTDTAKARVLFAKAELAQMQKKPEVRADLLKQISQFQPKILSATLLANVGDYLLAQGKFEKATPFFRMLLDEHTKSPVVDYAYSGLGEIAFHAGNYNEALDFFDRGIDSGYAASKLKDLTLGRAKTYLALGDLPKAEELFKQVAGVREWRGESTAYAVYSLGEIELKKNKLPEAIAYFQRVYVAYPKYTTWAAKSYIASADAFEKLGKSEEAANTYKELLRNERLSKLPEFQEAGERLKKMGQG